MKIVLPLTADDTFPVHYGQARKFQVFEVDKARRYVRRRILIVPKASRPCQWPRLVRTVGADAILVDHIGTGARQNYLGQHIAVIDGVSPRNPEDLVAAWMDDQLQRSTPPSCDHHQGGHGIRHDS